MTERPITLDVDQPIPLTGRRTPKIHLVVCVTSEFEHNDEVLAALTDLDEADRLLHTYERMSRPAADDYYEIRTVPVHASAAAALGLA